MKKTIYLKSIFLLFALLAGVVNAHADDYELKKVTDLDDVADGDVVLLVDDSRGLALSNNGTYDIRGVEIAVGEDNVTGDVTANMLWTIESQGYNSLSFNNNGDYLWGSLTTPSVSVSSTPLSDATNVFVLDDYGTNGGKFYYEGSYVESSAFPKNYLCWSPNNDHSISIEESTTVRFTLYKATVKNYVKWKRVDGDKVTLSEGDEVVIVDLTTSKAMSNDKGDKDPAAVAVTLNDDQDRIIMDEVPENVQWNCSSVKSSASFITQLSFETKDGQNLYGDKNDKVLKVGNTDENSVTNFIWWWSGSTYNNLIVPLDKTDDSEENYLCYSDDSMFSNVWKLEKVSNNNASNAQIVIFKKVEDPQRIVKIEMPDYYNYDFGKYNNNEYTSYDLSFDDNVTITGAEKSEIKWKSSNTDVIEINEFGYITQIKKRGTAVITAYVEEDTENYTHDKASAQCTVIVDDLLTEELGSKNLPLTVAEAKELAETGHVTHDGEVYLTWEEGVHYYVKGKVSKVNSGMMAMFGDMDFGEMMGGSGSEDSMDDMDFDPEDMEESGFDMSSMGFDMSSLGFDLSAMFGTSDKVTYYISDDGTKDGQMKVINGCGTLKSSNGTMEFNPIPKLSAGDCVVVCGPLVYTEDTNMFSSMMGGNKDEQPKMSGKVDEMNYLAVYDPTLLITEPEPKEIFVNKTLDGSKEAETPLYTIDELFNRFNEDKFPEGAEIQPATYKSSDEDIAKWDEETNIITGVNEGKAKITVKVKVVLPKREGDDDSKERSYTMKRKFKVIVKTRDLDPAGYYDGEWVLTEDADDLKEGTRLVLVGTRVKEGKEDTDYMMVENNAMMGGGKNGSKIEFDEPTIPSSTVTSKKGLEVVLEQAEDGTSWYLNVGTDENDTPLYLYASVKEESSNTGDQQSTSTTGTGGGGFNIDEIMEMFNPSSGLKVGTKAGTASKVEGVDSLKAIITFNDNIATIKFPAIADDKNNTIMLTSSFDMESMMEMFGGMGGNKEEEENPEQSTGDDTTEEDSGMGDFDMFMASFNTKKLEDAQPQTGEDGETKAPKCFMPRIYRFVPDESYDITIGSTQWKTIVSYKDVEVPTDVEAYVVTKVVPGDDRSKAVLKEVEDKQLKGGEPYLLHSASGNYELTLLTPNDPDELPAPEKNLLLVSNKQTSGEKGNTSVYVLADKSNGVGFYKWVGGDLGSGRVYLPVEASVEGAHEYCGFLVDGTTAIQSIDDAKTNVGPIYDLQGRRVQNLTKGVYVVDGKKVVIK